MNTNDLELKWFNTVFYPQRKTARAHLYEEGVLPRMEQREITLFTPWGPRYSWTRRGTAVTPDCKETKTIEALREILQTLEANMPSRIFSWIFLGADIYGARINSLPEEAVCAYFESLKKAIIAVLPRANFSLWSEFDKEAEPYRGLIWSRFDEYVDPNLLFRARQTASAMRSAGDPKAYLVERLAEAMLIEEKYRPIKISCVARHKDDKVDWQLPRVYILPECLHAPWL